jgi:mannose-6-phosphate isomerase-like protein (cupin superfamily)
VVIKGNELKGMLLVPVLLLCAGSIAAQDNRRPRAFALAPDEPKALTYDAGASAPNSARLLTPGDNTAGAWSLVELTEMPATKTTWHRHPHSDQSYFVREGVFTVKVEDKIYELKPGGYVFIPRGTAHGHANFGSQPVKVLLTNAPAGFEQYLQARSDLSKTMNSSTPEFQKRMSDLRKRYDIEELGVWDVRK